MGGPYYIPRNVKGEGRILYIFSTKALIYTGIGAGIGAILYFIFNMLGLWLIGFLFVILFGFIGFVIGTFKVPKINTFEATRKTNGENIDDVIKRTIKFKMNKKKLYIHTKEEI